MASPVLTVEPHILVGLLLSALIGLSLGLIGAGGSIVTVPLLVYVMRVRPHEAEPISLAVVGATALVGAGLHYRHGTLSLRIALLFAAAGVIGALFGSRLTYLVSASTLMLIFAALMLVVAVFMLRERRAARASGRVSARDALAAGLGAGILTGFLGVGGGFLIVPALVLFGGLAIKDAIGSSLLVITINSAAGFLGHLGHGAFDLRLAAAVTAMAVLGALVGVSVSRRVSAPALRKGFAWFVIAVAVFLVMKNLPA